MAVRQAAYAAPAAACAAEVLSALKRSDQALTLAQLERTLPRSKSLIFRVLRELESRELVARDSSGRYRLGIEAFELGAAYLHQSSYTDVIRQTLEQLARDTGDTVNLGVLRGGEVLYIMKFPGASSYVTISRVGGRVPANCVAIGKALLAQLPEEEIRGRLRDPLTKMTERSVDRVDDLLDELGRVRRDGYAVDREQAALGRCAVALTAKMSFPDDLAAISLSTAASTFDTRREALVQHLQRARDTLTRDHQTRIALAHLGPEDRDGIPDALDTPSGSPMGNRA